MKAAPPPMDLLTVLCKMHQIALPVFRVAKVNSTYGFRTRKLCQHHLMQGFASSFMVPDSVQPWRYRRPSLDDLLKTMTTKRPTGYIVDVLEGAACPSCSREQRRRQKHQLRG